MNVNLNHVRTEDAAMIWRVDTSVIVPLAGAESTVSRMLTSARLRLVWRQGCVTMVSASTVPAATHVTASLATLAPHVETSMMSVSPTPANTTPPARTWSMTTDVSACPGLKVRMFSKIFHHYLMMLSRIWKCLTTSATFQTKDNLDETTQNYKCISRVPICCNSSTF